MKAIGVLVIVVNVLIGIAVLLYGIPELSFLGVFNLAGAYSVYRSLVNE